MEVQGLGHSWLNPTTTCLLNGSGMFVHLPQELPGVGRKAQAEEQKWDISFLSHPWLLSPQPVPLSALGP